MPRLVVRNVPLEFVVRLKRRAAEHGVSTEAEHRVILRKALLGESLPSLKDLLSDMPDVGDDGAFARAPG